jgi:hypothetical protein
MTVGNKTELRQTDLDERIVEELREDDRTRGELVAELGVSPDRIRTRLQFLSQAGYVEKIDEETDRYELREDPQNQTLGWLDESHYLVRVAASAAVMLLAGGLYYGVFQLVLPRHTVLGGLITISLGFLTGWLTIPPRRKDDIRPDDPRNSPPLPPF